jgi:hypothetical protein
MGGNVSIFRSANSTAPEEAPLLSETYPDDPPPYYEDETNPPTYRQANPPDWWDFVSMSFSVFFLLIMFVIIIMVVFSYPDLFPLRQLNTIAQLAVKAINQNPGLFQSYSSFD